MRLQGRLINPSLDALKLARDGPKALYQHFVAMNQLRKDASQESAVEALTTVFLNLREGVYFNLRQKSDVKGVYLHGGCGTGKTLLMDVFLVSLQVSHPEIRAKRTHIHNFMREVHQELRELKMDEDSDDDSRNKASPMHSSSYKGDDVESGESPLFVQSNRFWLLGNDDDRGRRRTGMAAAWMHVSRKGTIPSSIERVGRRLAKEIDVLCLDEVSITTIQDCVVLAPLLRILCSQGVTVVATSNRAPEDLYSGGLNRHLHLPPLLQSIQRCCHVQDMKSFDDHRVSMAESEDRNHGRHPTTVFTWQCEQGSCREQVFFDEWLQRLSGTSLAQAIILPVDIACRRILPVLQSPCGACGIFSFSELFEVAQLSADDFEELCKRFRAVLVSDVPPLALSLALRWIWFIDQCYENHTRLVLTSSATGPDDLVHLACIEGQVGAGGGRSLKEVSLAVARATSRLHEMQAQLF
jgi:predicted ATPase